MTPVVRRSSERTLEVAGRDWPAVFDIDDIRLTRIAHFRRRARVMFEGTEVSVIWGSATYSDNHDHDFLTDGFAEEPERVEVGLFPGGELEVLGYVPAHVLATMLEWLAKGGSVETLVETWKDNGGYMG